jgi:hypothetical protein
MAQNYAQWLNGRKSNAGLGTLFRMQAGTGVTDAQMKKFGMTHGHDTLVQGADGTSTSSMEKGNSQEQIRRAAELFAAQQAKKQGHPMNRMADRFRPRLPDGTPMGNGDRSKIRLGIQRGPGMEHAPDHMTPEIEDKARQYSDSFRKPGIVQPKNIASPPRNPGIPKAPGAPKFASSPSQMKKPRV